MADDKSKQARDRNQVAGGEEYEVRHFAEKHGITVEQVRELIGRVGNSREALEDAVKMMKS